MKRQHHYSLNLSRGRNCFTSLMILFGFLNVWANQHSVYIPSNPYTIQAKQNIHEIHMKNFGHLPQSGYPRLPSRTFYIQLSSHTEVNHVNISWNSVTTISGNYHIDPVLPLIPSEQEDIYSQSIMNDFAETRDVIYSSDSFYPVKPAEFLGTDFIGDIPYVKVQFTPIRYNPISRELEYIDGIQVDIDYTEKMSAAHLSSKKINSFSADLYATPNSIHEETASLLIIGSEIMTNTIESFIFWKSCLGVTTEFVTTQWIFTNQEGEEKAEQIRNFLKTKYQDGFQNVILIGHRDAIPYPKLYPDPSNHTSSGEVATDFYFAQLTGEWDKDGDGYPGEFGDDNVDVIPEIHVGRIPWSDEATVNTILENIIAYEKNQESWKSNGLLMGAISNFANENNIGNFYWKTDGASLMELMKQNVFQNTTTLYEKEGFHPSSFNCDLDLNQTNAKAQWNTGGYGCVTWWSHGNSKAAKRKLWGSDDGDNVPESSEMVWTPILSTSEYPVLYTNRPIVFANACDNGWPEKTSLGRKLIQNACTGIVTSSRLTYYALGWDEVNDGGNASLTYFFWEKYLKDNSLIGEALSQAKIQYYSQFNPSWQNLHNVYTFNYFGDPTIQSTEAAPRNGALACRIISNEDVCTEGLRVEILELSQTCYTDANGIFHLSMIPGGEYTLSISGESMPDFTTQITIVSGIQSESTITIPSTTFPEMTLSTTSLDVVLDEGSLSRNTLTISNTGEALLEYQLIYDTDIQWLRLDESQSSIEAGDQHQVVIDITAEDIDQGNYETSIQLTSNCQNNPSLTIPIKLTVVDVVAPDDIDDLHIADTGVEHDNRSILLEWTAPGDNGDEGQAEQYEIWVSYVDTAITDGDLKYGILLMEGIKPKPAGSQDGLWVPVSFENPQHILVKTWDEAGHTSISNIATYLPTTSITSENYTPVDFVLPNYPNPFNGETIITFSVSTHCNAKVTVHNEIGQQICTLMNESVQAGKYTVQWNATNETGMSVSSGVYFYHIQTGQKHTVRKMLFIK